MTAVETRLGTDKGPRIRRPATWTLTARQRFDLEMLAVGGFAPVQTYLGRRDYDAVCATMRMADGTLAPMPITLDLPHRTVAEAEASGRLHLCDEEGAILATLRVQDAWRPDLVREAELVYGTADETHAGVRDLLRFRHPWYVCGDLEIVETPSAPSHADLRHTPEQLRAEFARRGWDRVVAFQTRNPMHRAHYELTVRAAEQTHARLLLHPIAGLGKPGDVDLATRVRCYRALLPSYPAGLAMLSLLPLAMRMAGPREAVWHAQIRRNYGATHFIVGRDHAGPGLDANGRPFYDPDTARALASAHAAEIGLEIVGFPRVVYRADTRTYCFANEVPPGAPVRTLSGTELRARIAAGRAIPTWFTPPPVAAELRRSHPPLRKRGFTVFLTGLSGAGKSTIARALCAELADHSGREVTLLDGDMVRRTLSPDLGYSRADRDRNVARIGFVAAEIVRHRGIAVCCPIAPYDEARRRVRHAVEALGGFLLVHVATPLETCEARDRKGLYARARAGELRDFTGVDDGYEVPTDADVVVDTRTTTPAQAVTAILQSLAAKGYLVRAGAA